VDADLVGDLLHLQRLDVLGALVEERPLMLDDGLRHLLQGATALLDRLQQPLRRLDLALQVLLGLRVGALVAVQLDVAAADVDVRHPVVHQADRVLTLLGALDDDVRHDVGDVLGGELRAGPRVQVA
jgi:hypothetical protein